MTPCFVDWAGEHLQLLPERALWWPAARVLFVADLHLGKAATYRALGQPVPGGTTQENLSRLDALVAHHAPSQLVFLGDFLHAAEARTPAVMQALDSWRERHVDLAMTLVRGNHDSRAGDPPASLRIEVVEEPHLLGPFACCLVAQGRKRRGGVEVRRHEQGLRSMARQHCEFFLEGALVRMQGRQLSCAGRQEAQAGLLAMRHADGGVEVEGHAAFCGRVYWPQRRQSRTK